MLASNELTVNTTMSSRNHTKNNKDKMQFLHSLCHVWYHENETDGSIGIHSKVEQWEQHRMKKMITQKKHKENVTMTKTNAKIV